MLPSLTSLTLLSALASPALAQVHQVDIVPRVLNNKMQTGWYSPCLQAAEYPHRLFVTTFGSFDTINDPGYDAEAGGLPANTQIGFDILAALRVWNGTDFSTIAQPRLRIRYGPPSNSRLTPTADTTVTGFPISTSAAGAYHFHYNYTLLSQAIPAQVPAESGIYLLAMRLWANAPGIAPSDPYYIVLNQGLDEATLTTAAAAFAQSSGLQFGCATAPACTSDINDDGAVDGSDFVAFVNSFSVGDPSIDPAADINADGTIDGADFVAFINAFSAGC